MTDLFEFLAALALAAVALAAPAKADNADIAVCFAPEQNCAAFAVDAIDRAQREILVGAYNLTTGSGIAEALVAAKLRGVDVRVIADRTTPCERLGALSLLATAHVPVWIDNRARIAHAKTMVIDGAVVLAGSYNWTRGAASNSEDLNLITSSTIAANYAAHWQLRLSLSAPLADRNWCP